MDFDIPEDVTTLLKRLDSFIDEVIRPLERSVGGAVGEG